MDIFIGICIGVYVMGVLIGMVLKMMGSTISFISVLFWPISWITEGWK